MWMIGIGIGIISLIAGLFAKKQWIRLTLAVLGVLIILASFAYGILVWLLLGGID